MLTGVNDRQAVQFQVADGMPHGRRELRGGGMLDFKTPSLVSADNEKIEFGAAMGGPEEAFLPVGAQMAYELIQNKALPGSPSFG